MDYQIELKPKAEKDIKGMPISDRKRLVERFRLLANDLGGDVKKLTNYEPEYRMRSGDWRVLFTLAENRIIVYRILHRREAYR